MRGRVHDGRLVVDEPTELPEGTIVELVEPDRGDDLSADDRAALRQALASSMSQAKAGRVRPVSEIVDEILHRT